MRLRYLRDLVLIAFISLAGEAQPAPLNDALLLNTDRWDFYVADDGELWLAYYASDSRLRLRAPDGTQALVALDDRREAAQSGLAIVPGAGGAALAWRDRYPTRGLYFQPGPGAAPVSLAGDSEPLTRMRVVRVGGRVHVIWLGEKYDLESGERYHLYHRSVAADGTANSPITRLMPAIYPLWIVDGDDIAVFSERWRPDGKTDVIAMQRHDPRTGKFGRPVEVPAPRKGFGPAHSAFASAGRWFLMWLGQDSRGHMVLQGVHSDDKGEHWTQFEFDDLRNLDVARFDVASDSNRHLAVALSGRFRGQPLKGRESVYLLRSNDNGTSWSKATHLRPSAVAGFRGRLPSIAFGATPGELVVVWQDWRDIRSAVYAALSRDYGKTWAVEGTPLTALSSNHGLPLLTSALRPHSAGYVLVYSRFTTDELMQQDLFELRFDASELEKLALGKTAGAGSHGASGTLLEQRADAFWKASEAADYQATYEFFDPFFRAHVSRASFEQRMGSVKYHSHELGETRLEGRLGGVKTTIEMSVPETVIDGVKVSKDRQTAQFWDLWVFVDDQWYREYYEETSGKTWTRY